VESSDITRNKQIPFNRHTHERVTQVISAGLLDFASHCSDPTCSFVWNASDRFLAALTVFYLNSADAQAARGEPQHGTLFKIRPVIDTLITQFQDVYPPEEELTVDEAMCPFRGRIFFRVCIKRKPHKYGTKMFDLSEAKSGHVCSLAVHTGAHPTN
jgi:hypothetical protein